MEDNEMKDEEAKCNLFEYSEDTDKNVNSNDELLLSRREDGKWSIEEEYLFFEGQALIGNKWTFLNNLLPNKTAKQMKNHFYSSIVKTTRKIVRSKFELDSKNIIITYYSLIYLKQLFKTQQYLYLLQTRKDKLPHSNITLKKLILSKDVTLETINAYSDEFEARIKEYFKAMYQFPLTQSIPQMFNAIIKAKLILQCLSLFRTSQISTEASCSVIYKYIEGVFLSNV